jgi:hypothetical protein
LRRMFPPISLLSIRFSFEWPHREDAPMFSTIRLSHVAWEALRRALGYGGVGAGQGLFGRQDRLADNPIGRFEAPAATINSPVSFRLNFCFRPKAEIRLTVLDDGS